MAYFMSGFIQAGAGFLAYCTVMGENGFNIKHLMGVNRLWYSKSVSGFEDMYGQEWPYKARRTLEFSCHLAYFVAIVVCQWSEGIIRKTRRLSIVQQGMNNWVLNISFVFTGLMCCFLSYTPGLDTGLQMFGLRFSWYFVALPFAVLLIWLDEGRRHIVRTVKGSFLERETDY